MYAISEVTLRPSVVVALRDTDQRVMGPRYPFPGKGVRVLVPAKHSRLCHGWLAWLLLGEERGFRPLAFVQILAPDCSVIGMGAGLGFVLWLPRKYNQGGDSWE